MRPVLKSYVGFGTSDDGVFFEAGERSFELKDPKLFPLVSRLLRTLDGTRTTQAIADALPEHIRPLFRTLVTELDRNAMLQIVSSGDAAQIPAEVAARYRTTLAFLQDESPSGAAHFLTWRTQQIVVGGTGHSHRALLRGLIGSGAGNLLLIGDVSDAVSQLLVAHGEADPAFAWRQIGTLEDAPDASRFLFAADDFGEALTGEPILAHPAVLAGGVYRGRGLVGPCGGPLAWSMLRPFENPLPFPASTLGVIGALLSFEALKALLYAERTQPGEARWDAAHLFTITAAADIAVHPIGDPPPSAARAPSPNATAPVASSAEPVLDRPFDATGPFTWQEPGGREYPLPRRAILIRRPDGREERVSQWALTPQQLDLRTVCKAAATLAGAGTHAASDHAGWLQLAQADAIVRSRQFEQAISSDIDPSGEMDPALQMLVRLARLYSEAMPRLRIACVPGLPAFLAEATVSDVVGRAAHGSAISALVEALGDAISGHQHGTGEPVSSGYWPLAEPRGPARRVAELPSGPDRQVDLAFAPEILTPDYLIGTGIVLGRMVLE